MAYDPNNIFARILRGEIPNKTVLDTTFTLAFHDIEPQAPVHVLVIPKGPYVTYDQFLTEASAEEQLDFFAAIASVIRDTGVAETGYRLITNNLPAGGQEVPHLHVHVVGGKTLGPMLPRG